jgi:hypothetical protein
VVKKRRTYFSRAAGAPTANLAAIGALLFLEMAGEDKVLKVLYFLIPCRDD